MRATRKLRRAAIEHSTQRGVAILINDVMPSLIESLRRMHDIQRLQNERMTKWVDAAHSPTVSDEAGRHGPLASEEASWATRSATGEAASTASPEERVSTPSTTRSPASSATGEPGTSESMARGATLGVSTGLAEIDCLEASDMTGRQVRACGRDAQCGAGGCAGSFTECHGRNVQ